MGVLPLALRGLWFRRWVSLAVLVVASLVVGAAATGPLFFRAAGESVLRDSLNEALLPTRVLSDHVLGPLSDDPLGQVQAASAAKVAQRPAVQRLFGPPVASLAVPTGAGARGKTPETVLLVYRDGVCSHVRITEGVCPDQPGTAMASTNTLQIEGWRVGQQLTMNGVPVTVVGGYTPVDPPGDYWGENSYFASSVTGVKSDNDNSLDAVFAPLATVQAQPPGQVATSATDRSLDLSRLRLTDVPALREQVTSYVEDTSANWDSSPGSGITSSSLVVVLDQIVKINAALLLPVVAVESQLLLLCWLVLFLLVANASEGRGPEVALAKLRGLSAGRTVAFGLLDTLLLVVLAVPAGFGLAWLLVTALTTTQLAPLTPVVATDAALLATAAAGAGAALAAVLAGTRTLRRPVVEQWRRATRRVKSRSWLVDAALAAAAVAALVGLARAGIVTVDGAQGGASNPLALVAPGLLVFTIALIGSRVLPLLCRAAYAPTRERGWTAAMLAVRQLGRRPSTLRLALVVAVAFGLVTFGIDALVVGRANAHDRAWTETGAAEVLTVTAPPGADLAAVVDEADPTGAQATVVSTVTDYAMPPSVLLMGVQPDRFARVAYWRPDFGAPTLADLTTHLAQSAAPTVTLAGTRLRVDVTSSSGLEVGGGPPPVLVADVAMPNNESGTIDVPLGPVTAGTRRFDVSVPCAPTACRLAGLHLQRGGTTLTPIHGQLTVTALQVDAESGWQHVGGNLTAVGGWRPAGPVNTPTKVSGAAAPGPGGLVLTADADLTSTPTWNVADYPFPVPAVLTQTASDLRGDTVSGFGAQPLPLAPAATPSVLPNGADRAVLVERDAARRAAGGATSAVVDTIWLTSDGAKTVPAQLEAAGVTVLKTTSAQHQAALYQRQGPELAILLFLVGAVLAAVLAGGGAVLNLYLTGRRRTYEIAAMSALGVRRQTLWAALAVEQGLLMGFGVVVGALSGLLAAKVALPSIPEFADVPAAPPLLYGLHPWPVLASLGLAVGVLAVVVAVSSANLVRASQFEQLREAAA